MNGKKVLIIKGSARKNGYTNRLCDSVAEYLADCEIKVFDAYAESFLPCDGCNYCEKNGKCKNRDLDAFFKSFEEADLIIIASPIYNGTFTAPVKALIDRFQVYYTGFYANAKTQQINKRRKAYFIASSGRDGVKSFEFMKWQLSCAFSILNIEFSGSVLCSHTDTQPKFNQAVEELKRSFADEQA